MHIKHVMYSHQINEIKESMKHVMHLQHGDKTHTQHVKAIQKEKDAHTQSNRERHWHTRRYYLHIHMGRFMSLFVLFVL